MNQLLALALILSAAQDLTVTVAPDQPIPYIYVDEPLIAEFAPAADGPRASRARVRVDITPEHGTPFSIDLGDVLLRAGSVYWRAIEHPAIQGRDLYHAKFLVETSGVASEYTSAFCRIDRPKDQDFLPIAVNLAKVSDEAILAMSGIPVRTVRLDPALPDLEAQVQRARKADLQVIIAITAANVANAAAMSESLAKQLGEQVARWDIDPGGSAEQLKTIAEGVRRGGSRARIALVAADGEGLSAMLGQGAGRYVQALVHNQAAPSRDGIVAFRGAAERAGYEGLPLAVAGPAGGTSAAGAASEFARQLVVYLAAGAEQAVVDQKTLFDHSSPVHFGSAYPCLSALAHRLCHFEHIGALSTKPAVNAEVFRCREKWIIALWSGEGTQKVAVSLGRAADLALTDILNNPLAVPTLTDESLELTVSQEPVFLSGRDGAVEREASDNAARQEALAFSGNKEYQKHFPAEMIDLVKKVGGPPSAKLDRVDFFALLRMFPYIEEQWQAGKLPRAVAAPALASLSRLARALCVKEEEGGEPFIEPLKETLARCGEYQSRYVTSSANAAGGHERGDWLSEEVSRLTSASNQLSQAGRPIEASAVATLAEWRARSLEFAAKAAPLSEPEKLVEPELKKEEAPAKPAAKPVRKSSSEKTSTSRSKKK